MWMMMAGMWIKPLPEDVSLDGYRIDQTIHYTNTVIAIYFGIVLAALIFFIVRYRASAKGKASYLKGDSLQSLLITLCLGFLVFFSIDAVIEKMAFKDLKEAFWNFPKSKDAVRIEILARQFAWHVRYPGADGLFNTEDDVVPPLNTMHIPVDKPVVLQMDSFDVIHSFFVPNFRVKQDVVPGKKTLLWFQAKKTGSYEIACAELCGNSHYQMRGFLTVETQAEYDLWLKNLAKKQAEAAGDGDDWLTDDAQPAQGNVPEQWGWSWMEVK